MLTVLYLFRLIYTEKGIYYFSFNKRKMFYVVLFCFAFILFKRTEI